MEQFSALLDRLVVTPQRNGKLKLIADYCASAPDPDRGFAIAAMTRDLDIPSIKPAMLRSLIGERMDEALFAISYDYVGDLAETIALAWPEKRGANRTPPLSEVVETLQSASRTEGPRIIETYLDALDPAARWALLKLVTGGLRIGVSARLAKTALAQFGGVDVTEIEELWHGMSPPYEELFAWLEGRAEKPVNAAAAPFRPVMLAHPIDAEKDLPGVTPQEFVAEWKWDGIRVQAASENGARRLYSRTGDDIGKAFPDILEAMDFNAAIDGELLVYDPASEDYAVQPFGELQQRLNRKTVSKKLLASHPAFIRAYDILEWNGEDLRKLPFSERRARLEQFFADIASDRFDLSPLVRFETTDELREARANPSHKAIEGLMLKRKSAIYVPGRPKGEWWKWKRDPHLIDAVMMYAQRGHGKRSSFYSDYTFGVWRDDEIVPVGKAYFGFTDEELKALDKFVRDNTTDRFGPVRQVAFGEDGGLVLEIAFEGLNRSKRHKSGVAMRFPRIHRIRWDKPAREADRLETLEAMLPE
ncbi:cisplatin damage response ATP-dependent DNA ligase [Hyphococcus sp.]|uniref:cisplatin damage response ATP-dependent DNA ligase n=1 Tax=Hyphococcus sp. TaxID=2038636 RepID=UPI003CCBF827